MRIDDHVLIPLSDGVRLSARIWYPEENGRYPAILEYHPYPKRYVTADRDEIGHATFAKRGYVSLRVDMRGSGESEGFLSDEYTEQARQDAVELIQWIAEQPWCTGAVGMYGLSWGGYNGIQLATIAPSALKAIVVAGATDDRFDNDTHFMGGVMASEHVGWAVTLLSFLTRPPDPELLGDQWRQLWLDRLNQLEWILPKWLEHPTKDRYWTEGFPRLAPDGLRVPTLIAGGVYDVYINAILRLVTRQPEMVKGVIGPWGHHFPHRALPSPAIDWLNQAVRWFDRWLKESPNQAENDPPLRWFVTEPFIADGLSEGGRDGRWIQLSPTELADAPRRPLSLGENGQLGSAVSKSQIVIDSPATLGMAGGEFMPMGWGIDLPSEQRLDDALSVCFETEPLTESVEVVGVPTVRLALTSSAAAGFVVARLCDVNPNGQSSRIAIGAFELSTRAGTQPHAPLSESEPVSITIDMGGIAHRFVPGHRIRLALSNAYWPMFWPSNEEGRLVLDLETAVLDLPTPTRTTPYHEFGEGDGSQPLSKTALTAPKFERELVRDMPTGKAAYRITDEAPRIRFDDHQMETWNGTTRIYHIDEKRPGTAKMTIQRDIEVGRGAWQTATRIEATIESDAESFSSAVKMTIMLNGKPLLTREFETTNLRHLPK